MSETHAGFFVSFILLVRLVSHSSPPLSLGSLRSPSVPPAFAAFGDPCGA